MEAWGHMSTRIASYVVALHKQGKRNGCKVGAHGMIPCLLSSRETALWPGSSIVNHSIADKRTLGNCRARARTYKVILLEV